MADDLEKEARELFNQMKLFATNDVQVTRIVDALRLRSERAWDEARHPWNRFRANPYSKERT